MVYQIVTSMSDLIGNWLGVVAGGWGEGRKSDLLPYTLRGLYETNYCSMRRGSKGGYKVSRWEIE